LFDFSGVPHLLVAWGDSLTRFWGRWF